MGAILGLKVQGTQKVNEKILIILGNLMFLF